jgi:multidrug resistance efflux pump
VERGAVIARLDGELLPCGWKQRKCKWEAWKRTARYTILARADAVQAVQLEKTDVALEAGRIQRDNLNEQLRRTTIVAPFSGQVVQLLVEVGTVLAPSMPVAQLTDHRALELVLLVTASDRGRFRIGDALTVAASGARNLVGTVSSVGDRGDGMPGFAVRHPCFLHR